MKQKVTDVLIAIPCIVGVWISFWGLGAGIYSVLFRLFTKNDK
jgi:hypothetical protein